MRNYPVQQIEIWPFEKVIGILSEAKKPGVSIAMICAKHGISIRQFVHWYRQWESLAETMIKYTEYLEYQNKQLQDKLSQQQVFTGGGS